MSAGVSGLFGGRRRSEASPFASVRMCPSGYDTARYDLPFRAIARRFPYRNTAITMKPTFALALLGILVAGTASAQQRMFEWQPANDEDVRLDPANNHPPRRYGLGPGGETIPPN